LAAPSFIYNKVKSNDMVGGTFTMGLLKQIAGITKTAVHLALDKKMTIVTLLQPVVRRNSGKAAEAAASAERCAAAGDQLRRKAEKAAELAGSYALHAAAAMAEGRLEEAQRMQELQQHHARKAEELAGQHLVVKTAAAELAMASRTGAGFRAIPGLFPNR
jgi:hypothetical protein